MTTNGRRSLRACAHVLAGSYLLSGSCLTAFAVEPLPPGEKSELSQCIKSSLDEISRQRTVSDWFQLDVDKKTPAETKTLAAKLNAKPGYLFKTDSARWEDWSVSGNSGQPGTPLIADKGKTAVANMSCTGFADIDVGAGGTTCKGRLVADEILQGNQVGNAVLVCARKVLGVP